MAATVIISGLSSIPRPTRGSRGFKHWSQIRKGGSCACLDLTNSFEMEETDHSRDKAPLLISGSEQVLANLRVDIIFCMCNSSCGTFGLQGVCNLERTQ